MTRISDALRAAADRAPIADIHVETTSVAGRVRRQRALRTGSVSLVGAGAVAVIAFGALGSNGGLPTAPAADDGLRDETAISGAAGDAATEPGFVAPNMCGTEYVSMDNGPVTLTATLQDDLDREPADPALYDVAATTDSDEHLSGGRPYVLTLWNGIVVGDPLPVTADMVAWDDTSVPLETVAAGAVVNCWDGQLLPPGDYEHVVVQTFMGAVVGEPTIEPSPVTEPGEPTIEPDPALVDPNTSVSTDLGAAEGTSVVASSYSASVSVPFTVAGDVPKDPFGQYLNPDPEPAPQAELPDGAITPDAARAAYQDAITRDRWDMAAGTQRVVMTASGPTAEPDEWTKSYYGCPTDGTSGEFPAESATLSWLDVDMDAPSSISVSYGWVVDGNPPVTTTVTNVSEWALPNAYGYGQAALVLVKDGRVVAEAYPTSLNRNGDAIMMESAKLSSIVMPAYNAYLKPGESVSGDYIWRDVNGCWTSDGISDVGPGTYTLLTRQDVYVTQEPVVAYDGGDTPLVGGDAAGTFERDSGGGEGMSPEELAASSSGVDIAPAPGQEYDFASFQVWTSLGSISVRN